MEYLLKCSSRHCLQKWWPHLVRTGFFNANWQIAHCNSSSSALTKSSSYPPNEYAWASAILNWALTRRMIREWPADHVNWIPFYRLGRGGSIRLWVKFSNFVRGRKCLCHVFPLWRILHLFSWNTDILKLTRFKCRWNEPIERSSTRLAQHREAFYLLRKTFR